MNEDVRSRLWQITNKLLQNPLNECFTKPTKDIEGYTDIIKHPMDLVTVSQKLKRGEYERPCEWYSDVKLIYDNAMVYNEGTIIVALAEHQLKMFQKLAPGYECKDTKRWYEKLAHYQEKLVKIAATMDPVPIGIDPLVGEIVRNVDHEMPLSPKGRVDTIATLQQWVKEGNTDKLQAVTYILKALQPELLNTSGVVDVDFAALTERTMKGLFRYVKQHDESVPPSDIRH